MNTRIKKISEKTRHLVSNDQTREALQYLLQELPKQGPYAQYLKQVQELQTEFFQAEKRYKNGAYKNRYFLNEIHDKIERLLEELKHLNKNASFQCRSELEVLRKKLYLSRSIENLREVYLAAKKLTEQYPDEYEAYEFKNRVKSILEREEDKGQARPKGLKIDKEGVKGVWKTMSQFFILYAFVVIIYMMIRLFGIM